MTAFDDNPKLCAYLKAVDFLQSVLKGVRDMRLVKSRGSASRSQAVIDEYADKFRNGVIGGKSLKALDTLLDNLKDKRKRILRNQYE